MKSSHCVVWQVQDLSSAIKTCAEKIWDKLCRQRVFKSFHLPPSPPQDRGEVGTQFRGFGGNINPSAAHPHSLTPHITPSLTHSLTISLKQANNSIEMVESWSEAGNILAPIIISCKFTINILLTAGKPHLVYKNLIHNQWFKKELFKAPVGKAERPRAGHSAVILLFLRIRGNFHIFYFTIRFGKFIGSALFWTNLPWLLFWHSVNKGLDLTFNLVPLKSNTMTKVFICVIRWDSCVGLPEAQRPI